MTMDTTTLECDLIAIVMENPEALDDISTIIGRNDLSNPTNRLLWDAILSLSSLRRTYDYASLVHHLTESGRENLCAPLHQILSSGSSYAGSAVSKARRVRQVSLVRLLAQAGSRISELAAEHAGRDLTELLGEAESILSAVVHGNAADEAPIMDGVMLMRDVCSEFERAMDNPGISGISTGIRSLDERTDGLQPGNMIIIAGPPSMGKTAFAINLVQNALGSATLPIVVFSMEMPAVDIARRMVSTLSGTPYSMIKRGLAQGDDMDRIYTSASRLQNPLLKICDSSLLTPAKMRTILKRVAKEYGGVAMSMVDYVQLMDANRSNNNRTAELTSISRDLKRMAMEFRMPLLVLSQLTKDVEKLKRKPNNGDIRETGQLAQDADLIMFVHRQERYDDEPKQENIGKAEIIVTKNRNDGCGAVHVGYDGPTFRFFELAGMDKWSDA